MDVHCSLFTQVTVRRTLTLCSWLEKTCIHDRKQENRQILFHLFYIKVGNSDGLRWKKKKREFTDVLTDTSNNRSCRHIRRLHQNIWQLACLFSKKRVLNQEIWIYPRDKKKKSLRLQFHKFQPRAGCYLTCPFDEDGDCASHFLFLLFRAFHSPSWVAKLPKSSLTFLFLSASLKHMTRTTLVDSPTNLFSLLILVWYRMLSPPVHDLVELLSGQEARVLPDLPQSALELLLVLVLQSLLLSLLSGAATLLSIVQPDKYHTRKLENFLTDAVPAHWHASCHVFNLLLTLQRSWAWAASEEWVSSCPTPAGCEPQERCWWPPGSHREAPATKQTPWRRKTKKIRERPCCIPILFGTHL